MAGQIRDM